MTGLDLTVEYARRADPGCRFSEAEPVTLSGGGLPPSVEPRAFPQRPGGLNALLGTANGEVEQSLDAFQLRIQAPEDAHGLPVVVFIPGGGFTTGSGAVRWFQDPSLVHRDRCVLVTVTYRVGILGHLGPDGDLADSQRPLRDLVLALRWVHQNIARCGGDPDQVTLAGDSAGAWYAFALSTLEQTQGMVRRTALISLPWEPPLSAEAYRARWELARDRLQDAGGLAQAPVDALLDAQAEIAREFTGRGMPLMPAATGPVPADLHDFSVSASRLHVESLALLSTSEEAAAFLLPAPEQAFPDAAADGFAAARFQDPEAVDRWIQDKVPGASGKRRMIEMMTLHQFALAARELAVEATRAGRDVHLAGFSVQSPLPGAGSPHCMPLPFLFDGSEAWHDAPMLRGLDPELVSTVQQSLQDWFVGVVREGTPRVDGGLAAPFDPADPQRLEFDGGSPRWSTPSEFALGTRR